MKKKIIGVTLIVTLIVVAVFNINLSKTEHYVGINMKNVEALADESSIRVTLTCYKTISCEGTSAIVTKIYCDDCKGITCRTFSADDLCSDIL